MTHTVSTIPLLSPTPGIQRHLKVHRFGQERSGLKIYLQAALHADEWPGLLTLQHLIGLLKKVDQSGGINGEVVIVPYANPIGMDQRINGVVLGRHSFSAQGNFNRDWPDLSNVAIEAAEHSNSENKVPAIKQALKKAVGRLQKTTPLDELKAVLLHESIDADIVLDVHCDSEALTHIYCNKRQQTESLELAQDVACPVLLMEDMPDGNPFDSAQIKPWLAVEHLGVPMGCHSVTLELRGQSDVSDQLALPDAEGILRFMVRRGVISEVQTEIAAIEIQQSNLEAVDSVRSPGAGIIVWHKQLGDVVRQGETVASIVDPDADDPETGRSPVLARTTGILFSRERDVLVGPGDRIAKIAGNDNLENIYGGGLLSL
ncbi:succinylglutamate desuccinylase/aspartoacylase family protein [Endozoicomonas ascidiicola]|uniref:succinylglutamate desuccinylase/aspartoacylase family protein n=1 Tax=Endozoicomonas ascidiicola TaxID=1698521 RepID=UPI00082E1688|nr:succinylglutamate desuccinylase/aspartoacylase family protein [Endozoicomonas ascidiicola]